MSASFRNWLLLRCIYKATVFETRSSAVSARGRAMFRVIKYFAKSLKIIRSDTLRCIAYEFLLLFHSNYYPPPCFHSNIM